MERNDSERCTCLTMTQLAQMQARNEVVQSRYPCPVHGEPDWPEGMFIERIPVEDMEINLAPIDPLPEERAPA
jgi:hypothetical protein